MLLTVLRRFADIGVLMFMLNRRATAHHFLAEPYPFANQVFSLNQTRQKMTHRPPATLGASCEII